MRIAKVFTYIWPFAKLKKLKTLNAEAQKWHDYIVDYISDEQNKYFFTFLKNSGFAQFDEQRCFIVHTQLPAEVIATLTGSEFEPIDSVNIVEHIMYEKMQPVFNQLVNNNLLDIITIRHTYVGNGTIRTVMSNVAELEYLAYAETLNVKALRIAATVWKCVASLCVLAVLVTIALLLLRIYM